MPNTNSYSRIQEILDYYCITANAFSKRIGLKRPQSLYDIRDGKVKTISYYIAQKIHEAYKEIDLDWILTGQGEMMSQSDNDVIDKDKIIAIMEKTIELLEDKVTTLETEIIKTQEDGKDRD